MSVNSHKTTPGTPAAVARTLDACHYLNVSRSTLHRMVKNGLIRQVRLGQHARGFLYAELDRYLAAATAG